MADASHPVFARLYGFMSGAAERAGAPDLRRETLAGLEHVRADTPRRARLQDRVERIWTWVNGGCHPNRDTVSAIGAAGFVIERERRFLFQPCFLARPSAPHVIGVARKP